MAVKPIPYLPRPHAYQLVAMRRSGSHAVLSWLIARTLPGTVAHVNNLYRDKGRWYSTRIYRYEDGHFRGGVDPSFIEKADFIFESYEDVEPDVELPKGARRIMVLRDPYNMAASRMRKGWNVRADLWLVHALDAIGETNTYEADQVILYNQWLGYGWERVLALGGGSSFDGIRYDGKGGQMDTLNRWRDYEESREMVALMKDDKINRISRQLFGPIIRP